MNEEQKEQNIPAPVPPENNQNITPVKSWQIALTGIIIQVIVSVLYFFESAKNIIRDYGYFYPDLTTILVGDIIFFLIALLFWAVIIKILYHKEMSKTKAIISIIAGIFSIFFGVGVIAGIFLIISGFLYLKKEGDINKEQNIPASALPDNDYQSFLPIKSWHILLSGIILQLLVLYFGNMPGFGIIFFAQGTSSDPALAGSMLFLLHIVSTIIGFILIPFMYFSRTKRIGAIFCILLGLTTFMRVPVGIFSLFAGIYYFWKKV